MAVRRVVVGVSSFFPSFLLSLTRDPAGLHSSERLRTTQAINNITPEAIKQ